MASQASSIVAAARARVLKNMASVPKTSAFSSLPLDKSNDSVRAERSSIPDLSSVDSQQNSLQQTTWSVVASQKTNTKAVVTDEANNNVKDDKREDEDISTSQKEGSKVLTNVSSIFSTEAKPDIDEVAVEGNEIKPSNMFCLTCHQCVDNDIEHLSHDIMKIDSAIANQQKECENLLSKVTAGMESSTLLTENISSLKADLIKSRKAIAVELDEIFRDIEHKLQERKMVLFTQLTNLSYHKECYLNDQIQHFDDKGRQLQDITKTLCKLSESVTDASLIGYNCHKLKEQSELLQTHIDSLEGFRLTENTDLKFSRTGLSDVRRAVQNIVHISSSNVIPSQTTASGDGLKKSNVHKQTLVKITPRNKDGEIEREKGLQLSAQLYNEEVQVECQCIENTNSTYTVMYIAPEQGHYKLSVKLFDQQIKNSPFTVKIVPGARVTFSKTADMYELTRIHDVKSHPVKVSRFSSPRVGSPRSVSSGDSYSSLKILPSSTNSHTPAVVPPYGDYLASAGKFGRKRGEFSNPQGVCVDTNQRLYITDSTNQNIQIFTDGGSHISSMEQRGRQEGQFLRPIGICFTKDGCLIFSDYESKCINVFKDGAFVRRIGHGKLIGPKGVAVTHRGTFLVADNKGNQVLEFSIKGRLVRRIPTNKSDKAAQLAGPHYVAVNKGGEIYVTDFHSHCVKVYSREGEHLRSFGQHGTGNGQFNAPTGISIDGKGNVLVSDWGNSRVQVFDEEGSFLCHVDTSAAPLFGPQSIYAMREDKVAVADSGNHCVKIFHYET